VVRAASPESDSEDDDQGSDGKEPPGNFWRAFGEIFAARANVFGAGKLQFREFFDLRRGLCFREWDVGLEAALLGRCGTRLRRDDTRAFGFPDFVGIDLRLSQAGEIISNGLFVVESEMLSICANESLVEDAAGELVEMFLFDSLEHARADLGDIGDVIEREFFLLARFAEFVAEFSHDGLQRMTETS
jgi:hypothetical protein